MSLKLRALRGDDIFPLLAILNKLDVVDELAAMFTGTAVSGENLKGLTKKQLEAKTEEIGTKVLANIAKKALINIASIRDDLNEFLASLAEKDVAEIKELSMLDYLNGVKAIFQDPQFKDFFTSISS